MSRGAHDSDPAVVECKTAIAYLRARRALTAERPILDNALITQLTKEVIA